MSSKPIAGLLLLAALMPALPAQVVINEVYTATPDFIELRNIGNTAIDISGWTVRSFQGTGLTPETPFTIPAGTVLGPDDFLTLEEFGTAGAPGTLGPCSIRVGFNYNWTSTRNIVVAMTDAAGAGVDYVYRNQGGASGAPNLPGGTTWNGSLTTSGDVIHRQTDSDTDNASDWATLGNGSQTPCFFNPGQAVPPPPPPPFDLQLSSAGGGQVTVTLDSDPALPGAEYYTLVSANLQNPIGSGPVFGMGIDVLPQFGNPLIVGSPFHGLLDANGDFTVSFPAGAVPVGLTIQAVSVAIKSDGTLEISDNEEITF